MSDGRPGPHVDPESHQAKLLDKTTLEVARMPEVFEDAQRNRDAYQQRLHDMIEDTLKRIQRAKAHMAQKARHVRDTSKSYDAKFEHEINCVREELRRDLRERTAKIEEAVDQLDSQCGELEADLAKQHEFRLQHIEENLGPIRDEVARLTQALEQERKDRIIQEARRERMLSQQVAEFNKLLDAEKFDRSRQLAEFTDWANHQQQHVAKLQYQAEHDTKTTSTDLRKQLVDITKDRVAVQHQVIESIASFVKKYHENLHREVSNVPTS